jgi:hypothetical protein
MILGENEYCYKLAKYLQDYLNLSFSKLSETRDDLTNQIVVRSIRNWDDPGISVKEFPCLKVYRNNDSFDRGGNSRTSLGTITYSVSYANLKEIPDLMYWVSYKLNQGLNQFHYETKSFVDFPPKQGNQASYLLTASEFTQSIYPFLRFQIRFLDDCMNYNQY